LLSAETNLQFGLLRHSNVGVATNSAIEHAPGTAPQPFVESSFYFLFAASV
jgi:hypothetical protein